MRGRAPSDKGVASCGQRYRAHASAPRVGPSISTGRLHGLGGVRASVSAPEPAFLEGAMQCKAVLRRGTQCWTVPRR